MGKRKRIGFRGLNRKPKLDIRSRRVSTSRSKRPYEAKKTDTSQVASRAARHDILDKSARKFTTFSTEISF